MIEEEVQTVGGVDRNEAENALDVLMRASQLGIDTKMMNAVKIVAEERRRALDMWAPTESYRSPKVPTDNADMMGRE